MGLIDNIIGNSMEKKLLSYEDWLSEHKEIIIDSIKSLYRLTLADDDGDYEKSFKYHYNSYVSNFITNRAITSFVERLKKIGIEVELAGNYPWIYLDKINGKKVTEKFEGNHGFTIGFIPIRVETKFHFTDIGEIFKILRKYGKCNEHT